MAFDIVSTAKNGSSYIVVPAGKYSENEVITLNLQGERKAEKVSRFESKYETVEADFKVTGLGQTYADGGLQRAYIESV